MPRKTDEEALAATIAKAEEIKARIANRGLSAIEKDREIIKKAGEIIVKQEQIIADAEARIADRSAPAEADEV